MGMGSISVEEYNYLRPCFDNIGKVQSLEGKEFQHEEAIEDHWMNATNDYNVCIRDYCRMTLYFTEKVLNISISEEILHQDSGELFEPFLPNIELSYNNP